LGIEIADKARTKTVRVDVHGESARDPVEDPPLHCYGVTRAPLLKLMGHNYGRDNAKKRAVRRKKTERLALAKKNKKKTAK
jgi:hypothetical protein